MNQSAQSSNNQSDCSSKTKYDGSVDDDEYMNNHGLYVPNNRTTCIDFITLEDETSWPDIFSITDAHGNEKVKTNMVANPSQYNTCATTTTTTTPTYEPSINNIIVEPNNNNNMAFNAEAIPFKPSFLPGPMDQMSSPRSSLTDHNGVTDSVIKNKLSESAIIVNWLLPRKLMQLAVQKIKEQLRMASIEECAMSPDLLLRRPNAIKSEDQWDASSLDSNRNNSNPWIMLIKFPMELVNEIKAQCFFHKYQSWPQESLSMTNRDLLHFFNDSTYQYHRSPISSLMINLFLNGFLKIRSERYKEINEQYQHNNETIWKVPNILFADSMLYKEQINDQSFFKESFAEYDLNQVTHIFIPIYDDTTQTWPRAILFRIPWNGVSGWVTVYHFTLMTEEELHEIDNGICRRIISWFHRETTAGGYLPALDASFREESVLHTLHILNIMNHWQWIDGRGIIFLSEFLSRPRLKNYEHEIKYLLDDTDAFINGIDVSYINDEVMRRNPTELLLKWIAVTIAVYTQYYGRCQNIEGYRD